MGDDKRKESRASVAHEFNVMHESFGVRPSKSRDLSLDGIFVEGDVVLALEGNCTDKVTVVDQW